MVTQKIKNYSLYVRLINNAYWTMTHTATVNTLDEVTARLKDYVTCSDCPLKVDCLIAGSCRVATVTAIFDDHKGEELKIIVRGESIEYRF